MKLLAVDYFGPGNRVGSRLRPRLLTYEGWKRLRYRSYDYSAPDASLAVAQEAAAEVGLRVMRCLGQDRDTLYYLLG